MRVLEEGKVKYGEVVKGNKHMVLVHFINSQQVYKKYRYRPCDRCDGQENKDMRTDEQSGEEACNKNAPHLNKLRSTFTSIEYLMID